MTKLTVDGREFVLQVPCISKTVSFEPKSVWFEWAFEENGKRHLCRQEAQIMDDGSYEVMENKPAVWFVEE